MTSLIVEDDDDDEKKGTHRRLVHACSVYIYKLLLCRNVGLLGRARVDGAAEGWKNGLFGGGGVGGGACDADDGTEPRRNARRNNLRYRSIPRGACALSLFTPPQSAVHNNNIIPHRSSRTHTRARTRTPPPFRSCVRYTRVCAYADFRGRCRYCYIKLYLGIRQEVLYMLYTLAVSHTLSLLNYNP